MDIDCIESAEGSGDVFDSDDLTNKLTPSLWNGRHVELITEKNLKLELITQFYLTALQQIEAMVNGQMRSHHYDFLELKEEIFEEISLHFDQYVEFAYLFALYHPLNREFALADPTRYQTDIVQCRNIFKTVVKSVRKCAKKVVNGVKKGAETVADFVKDHKKEILIGAAVVAAAAGAYLVAGALSGTAAGAEAVNGTHKRREDEEDPVPGDPEPSPSENPTPVDNPPPDANAPLQSAIANFLETLQRGKIENPPALGVPSPVDNSSPEASAPLQSVIAGFLKSLGHSASSALLGALPSQLMSALTSEPSCYVETEGTKHPGMRIGFINGMNTSLAEDKSHLYHIKKFAGDLCIEGVYNHSNGIPNDLGESLLNYLGVAPATANLLVKNWTQFHEENKDNPAAKYLQFTHSMGTIQAKDALQNAPQEIRDRVIIVAIGPAVIIPEGLCYDSAHYASKKDIVHYGENIYMCSAAASNSEPEQTELLQQLIESKQQLILLDPHPDAKGIDHEFESPTFDREINEHIQNYLKNNGQYR